MRTTIVSAVFIMPALFCPLLVAEDDGRKTLSFPNSAGVLGTLTTNRSFDFTGPFFQSLGSNGRSCGTCHQPGDAWSIAPASIQQRFNRTNGSDPLFRTNDGSNCADADVSSPAKARAAYSLLLEKGLLRVQLPLPAGAEFTVLTVDDPYGCAPIPGQLSVYRRVLPATNLKFLSTVMWDGRETLAGKTILEDLAHQVVGATLGHAQAAVAPTQAQVDAIVAFEMGTFTAQKIDKSAGRLDRDDASGGPEKLANQVFFLGINDPLGGNPTEAPFNPVVFTLFNPRDDHTPRERASIARGEIIFNTRQFNIDNVGGLPMTSLLGTCTVCHDSPNVGNHSVTAPLNIGLADKSRRTPDLPLFRLVCTATHEIIETLDPGRALISGKCADIGKFKGPILRGLAARAPYFHNGSAASLAETVDFYETRFHIGLSHRDKADLIAFLNAL